MEKSMKFKNDNFSYDEGVLTYFGSVFDINDPVLKIYAVNAKKLILKDTVTSIKYKEGFNNSSVYYLKLQDYFPELEILKISSFAIERFGLASDCNLKRVIITGNNTSVYGLVNKAICNPNNPTNLIDVCVPVDYQYPSELSMVKSVSFCYPHSRSLKFDNPCRRRRMHNDDTKYYLVFNNASDLIYSINSGDFQNIINHFIQMVKNGVLKEDFKFQIRNNNKQKDDRSIVNLLNKLYELCGYSLPLFGTFVTLAFNSYRLNFDSSSFDKRLEYLCSAASNKHFMFMIMQVYSTLPKNHLFYIPNSTGKGPFTFSQEKIGSLLCSDIIREDLRVKKLNQLLNKCNQIFMRQLEISGTGDITFNMGPYDSWVLLSEFLQEVTNLYAPLENDWLNSQKSPLNDACFDYDGTGMPPAGRKRSRKKLDK